MSLRRCPHRCPPMLQRGSRTAPMPAILVSASSVPTPVPAAPVLVPLPLPRFPLSVPNIQPPVNLSSSPSTYRVHRYRFRWRCCNYPALDHRCRCPHSSHRCTYRSLRFSTVACPRSTAGLNHAPNTGVNSSLWYLIYRYTASKRTSPIRPIATMVARKTFGDSRRA